MVKYVARSKETLVDSLVYVAIAEVIVFGIIYLKVIVARIELVQTTISGTQFV